MTVSNMAPLLGEVSFRNNPKGLGMLTAKVRYDRVLYRLNRFIRDAKAEANYSGLIETFFEEDKTEVPERP